MAGRKQKDATVVKEAEKKPEGEDAELASLDKGTRDFLANTQPPVSNARPKIEIENGKLYEIAVTAFEPGVEGDYGTYTRYSFMENSEEKAFYLGSSVDQKTMNRYIEGWLKEGHVWPFKVKFVRYPRKSQKTKKTYFDIRADLISSGEKAQ